tara:strand:+ start:519 stop:665 length:147 start_codon:yes stop_codon:yes gene_type:complete
LIIVRAFVTAVPALIIIPFTFAVTEIRTVGHEVYNVAIFVFYVMVMHL